LKAKAEKIVGLIYDLYAIKKAPTMGA